MLAILKLLRAGVGRALPAFVGQEAYTTNAGSEKVRGHLTCAARPGRAALDLAGWKPALLDGGDCPFL